MQVSCLCPGVIDTAIVRTSTMRGGYEQRRTSAVGLYAKRGTSPEVVARQALDGIARGRTVIPTPRHQVLPQWLLKRYAPGAARALTVAVFRRLAPPR